jgi:hypothetical protein
MKSMKIPITNVHVALASIQRSRDATAQLGNKRAVPQRGPGRIVIPDRLSSIRHLLVTFEIVKNAADTPQAREKSPPADDCRTPTGCVSYRRGVFFPQISIDPPKYIQHEFSWSCWHVQAGAYRLGGRIGCCVVGCTKPRHSRLGRRLLSLADSSEPR